MDKDRRHDHRQQPPRTPPLMRLIPGTKRWNQNTGARTWRPAGVFFVVICSACGLTGCVTQKVLIYGHFLVLPDRIELSTSPLPRECSTTELRQQEPRRRRMTRVPEAGGTCHKVRRGARIPLATPFGAANARNRARWIESMAPMSAMALRAGPANSLRARSNFPIPTGPRARRLRAAHWNRSAI